MNRLIRCAVTGEKLSDDVQSRLDDDVLVSIYKLSKFYDLAHIVGRVLDENGVKMRQEIAAGFKRQESIAIYRYGIIDFQLQAAKKALEAAKIPFILLKGAVMRRYYPEPWMRTSVDIDMLVKKDDLDAATAVFTEKLGYKSSYYSSHDVSFYSDDDVHIELHFKLGEDDGTAYDAVLDDLDEYIVKRENRCEAELTDEMFLFYHVAHTAKHLKNGGCGVRPLLDLWILNKNLEFDAAKKQKLLEKGGLSELATALDKLSEVWFGDAEHDEVTDKLEDFILSGGKFGGLENRARVAGDGEKKGTARKIFKPYDELKFWYPRLNGRKWLLPFYQVKRWFRILFGGSVKTNIEERKLKEKASASPDNEFADLFKKLGI